MDILVISDTHLKPPFEEKKYNLLEGIISQSDRVIINGDFWDGFLTTFKQFVESPWKNLFPLLKMKKTVYIFGNHDKLSFADAKKIELFSDIQTERYELMINNINYVFEHGNRQLPLENENREEPYTSPRKISSIGDRFERMMIQKFGSKYQTLLKRSNRIIKMKIKEELKDNEYFVCGHTHCAEIDHKNRFINTGVIKHGLAQYILFKGNAIYTQQERYN